MTKRYNVLLTIAACALCAAISSCLSFGGVGATPDERALSRGTSAWNSRGPEAARSAWSSIADKAQRSRQLSYIDGFQAGAAALDRAKAAQESGSGDFLAPYLKAGQAFAALPDGLSLPAATKAEGREVAQAGMRSLIDSGRPASARDMGKAALSAYGPSDEVTALLAEASDAAEAKRAEAAADDSLAAARSQPQFDDEIAGFEKAQAAYAQASASLAAAAKADGLAEAPGIAAAASSLKRKRQNALLEKEKLLRERAYSFKERIGEEFAKAPDVPDPSKMTLEDVKRHQESIKAGVEAAYGEMKDFAGRYPSVIDADLIRDVEAQKAALDAKIAQVDREIATAKDIASRGKPVMPLLIGLFNPDPKASSADSKKSRPALFRGSSAKKDYWWGMVSIDAGALNDLVITMKDGRAVRVFAENTLSGSLVGKKGIADLVNRGYRVGNSWPVLNAGGQLASGKYFIEVQDGKTAPYEGEAVVYSSFVVRMR